jgi:hypothetical protein
VEIGMRVRKKFLKTARPEILSKSLNHSALIGLERISMVINNFFLVNDHLGQIYKINPMQQTHRKHRISISKPVQF